MLSARSPGPRAPPHGGALKAKGLSRSPLKVTCVAHTWATITVLGRSTSQRSHMAKKRNDDPSRLPLIVAALIGVVVRRMREHRRVRRARNRLSRHELGRSAPAERDDLLPTRSWQRCSIRRAPAQRQRPQNRRAGTFLSVIATTRRVRAADRSRKRSADPIELDAMSACRRHMRCAKRRTTLRRSEFCLSSSPRAGSVAADFAQLSGA